MHFLEHSAFVTFALATLAFATPFTLLAGNAKPSKEEDAKKLKESEEATKGWLTLVDTEKFEKSWDSSSKVLQLTVPRAQWVKILEQIRKPLGKVVSRQITDVRISKDPHGLPPGDYMVFVYHTKFGNKSDGYEMLTLVFDEGKWQVMTYQVN